MMVHDFLKRLSLLPRIPPRELLHWRKLQLLWAVRPFSVMPYSRLSNLYELAHRLKGLEGSFVECGVMNGGSAGILGAAAKGRRDLWLFDSWQGLPEPTALDVDYRGRPGEKGIALGRRDRVEQLLFRRLRLQSQRIHIAPGWFEDTIPKRLDAIGPIALLHLDCDWYQSLRFCLDTLYDQVVPGGVVVVDDYGYWQGSKLAFEEFLSRRGLSVPLQRVDVAVMFRKEAA